MEVHYWRDRRLEDCPQRLGSTGIGKFEERVVVEVLEG
jgi:hypothetical protein